MKLLSNLKIGNRMAPANKAESLKANAQRLTVDGQGVPTSDRGTRQRVH